MDGFDGLPNQPPNMVDSLAEENVPVLPAVGLDEIDVLKSSCFCFAVLSPSSSPSSSSSSSDNRLSVSSVGLNDDLEGAILDGRRYHSSGTQNRIRRLAEAEKGLLSRPSR